MSDLPVSPSIISSRSDSHVARQVHAAASSLSTRRAHLASHESEYLDIIQRYGETVKRRNINARHLGLILRFPMNSIYTTGSN
jgi:hypothetical protein